MFDISEFSRLSPEWSERLCFYDEIESTNDEALRLAKSGAASGTVVLAEHQLSGRGRRGAEWLSEPGDGLLFSIIIRPDYSREYWSRLALASGLAVACCLRDEWLLPAEVKWPNDVLIGGRKSCGILVEASEDFAIVGVGLNVAYSPDEGSYSSTSMWQELGKPVSREEILADLLQAIWRETTLCGGCEFPNQLKRLREVCFLTEKVIGFQSNGQTHQGVFRGIAESGEMLVEQQGEILPFLQAEQVRVVESE